VLNARWCIRHVTRLHVHPLNLVSLSSHLEQCTSPSALIRARTQHHCVLISFSRPFENHIRQKMDESPLARLPAELRIQIHELVLQQDYGVEIRLLKWDTDGSRTMPLARVGTALATTKLCKQIRKETAGLFTSLNSFHVMLHIYTLWEAKWAHNPERTLEERTTALLAPLHSSFDAIGSQHASALTSITLHFGHRIDTLDDALTSFDLGQRNNDRIMFAFLNKLLKWAGRSPKLRLVLSVDMRTEMGGDGELAFVVDFGCAVECVERALSYLHAKHEVRRITWDEVLAWKGILEGWKRAVSGM